MTQKQNPLLVRLFFFLIFISATSAAYLLLPDEPPPHPPLFENGGENITTSTVILRPHAEESLKSVSITNNDVKGSFVKTQDDKTITDTTVSTSTENFQTAALTVNDQNYTLQFNTGENLLTAMQRLMASSIAPFTFSGKEYTGLGFFVEEINGVKNSSSANGYWIYYVNGQTAKVGISNYLLKSDDIIKWKYEKNIF